MGTSVPATAFHHAAASKSTAHVRTTIRSIDWALLGIIVAGLAFRVPAAYLVGLGFGESYHFSCAIRPQWSYFDHPPLAVWLSNLSMQFLGDRGPLAIRAPTLLMFVGTTSMVYWLGCRFFGRQAGLLAALLLNLSAVFSLSTAIFLQSDGPLMFFWLACICCLVRVLFDHPVRHALGWWAGVGVALGLTFLSKYHAAFLILGTLAFVVTCKEQRRWLVHPGPYLAIAIAAFLFLPVVIWNQQHQWISFLWQGNRGLQGSGIRLDWLGRCIGGQALWLLPWIWIGLLAELVRCFRNGTRDRIRWFIACLATGPIVLFTAVSAYAPIGFHFHWQAPGYLMLFLPLGATLASALDNGARWARWYVWGTVVFSVVGLLFVTTHAATGWWSRLGPQWLSDKVGESDDPTLECLDYWTLESALAEKGLLGRNDLFLISNRWFQSGKVDYALRGTMPVFCFSPDPRSFAFFGSQAEWLGKDAVLVSTRKFLTDPAEWYGKNFSQIESLGVVPVPRGGRTELELYLYYCRDFHTPYALSY